MRHLAVALMLIAAVAFMLSPIVYQVRTRGAWRNSPEGWHFMSYMGVLAMVMMLAVWSVFWGPLPVWVRAVTWGAIAVVAWWRLIVLLRVRP